MRLVRVADGYAHGRNWSRGALLDDIRAALPSGPEGPTDEAWPEFIYQVHRAQHVAIREGECPRFDLVECALALWREATPSPAPEVVSVPVAEPVWEGPSAEELLAMRSWPPHGHTFDSDLVDFGRRCYNLARRGTPAAPPAPEPGEVGEIADHILAELQGFHPRHRIFGKLTVGRLTRAATLLQQQTAPAPVVVPVAVSECPHCGYEGEMARAPQAGEGEG
jgi:hypothetical protein